MNGRKNFISLIEKRDVEAMLGFGGSLQINFVLILGDAHKKVHFGAVPLMSLHAVAPHWCAVIRRFRA
jgi:hypothetical protein